MIAPPEHYNPSLTVRLRIAGIAMLVIGVPATFGLIVGPLTRVGFDGVLDGLVVGLILGVPVVVVTPILLFKRLRWGRQWAAVVSTALLIGWVIDLLIALGYPLGLVHPGADAYGSLAPSGWTGLVFAIVMTLPAWWVWRLLRDPALHK